MSEHVPDFDKELTIDELLDIGKAITVDLTKVFEKHLANFTEPDFYRIMALVLRTGYDEAVKGHARALERKLP